MQLSFYNKIKITILSPILFICYLLYNISSKKKLIQEDTLRYIEHEQFFKWYMLLITLANFKAFRNVFFARLGFLSLFVKGILPGVSSCDLGKFNNVKGGFKLLHGYGVVINSEAHIGEQCTILQNVTIGDRSGKGSPKIGNNVSIGAGAILIGPITIKDNVKIGAGSIVVTDIPSDSIVVGIKAAVITNN